MQRRTFNQMLAATAALGAAGIMSSARAEVKELRLSEGGGLNGDAIDAGYAKPFTEKTGIKIIRENPNTFGKLRALVESGSTTTQMFELGSASLEQAKALGLVAKLDWEKIAPLPIFPEAKDDYGVGYQYYATLMCWRTGVKAPKNWQDFFNVQDFPGKRTMPDDPVYSVPIALLAAGVPIGKLYPLDVDLAFKKLDEIKKDVAVWWKAGAQPPQLLRDNEVQYGVSYSGRVVGQEGIEYTYNEANLNIGFITIVKGTSAEDTDAAYKFLHGLTEPKNQLVAASIVPYSGNSPDFEKLLPKEKISAFPTTADNKKVQFFNDADWWLKNAEMAQSRWQEFALNR
ncbi:extracellular solute-binding protein [Mesorhizobium sp. M7A.F.Ca.US.006.01.1.1]|uniref:extracellular solute-binding protein n=1 Tax=Mesorhizobium sp. M7A.F.Ca.US.006.01.1.1 TaxID=2496707 RepID=UPI000FCAD5FD|nr:extracellular solute-binding protein [Mesorhizobium sp. M7A.F.Ca.US.006.01.1.1]RUZ75995.1 extracellular solute-binding protein [Mesorhizobium sp. M7A.F.Ca.US.006.01.1.1]